MNIRRAIAPMAVAVVGVVGVQVAPASAAPVTRQSFTLTSDINEPGGTVVASGAINATGDDIVISDTEDQFVFPEGTLTVVHAPVRTHERFDERRCTVTIRERDLRHQWRHGGLRRRQRQRHVSGRRQRAGCVW